MPNTTNSGVSYGCAATTNFSNAANRAFVVFNTIKTSASRHSSPSHQKCDSTPGTRFTHAASRFSKTPRANWRATARSGAVTSAMRYMGETSNAQRPMYKKIQNPSL